MNQYVLVFVDVDKVGDLAPAMVELNELGVCLAKKETANKSAVGLVGEYLPERSCQNVW